MSPETAASLRTKLIDRRQQLERAVDERGSLDDIVRLVEQVDAALRRMDTGTYGTCTVCGTSIEETDLLHNPFAEYCLCRLNDQQQAALQSDLDLAQRIQRGLLPPQDVRAAGWEAHYRYQPAGPVSGDYCDLLTADDGDGDLYFAVADVSGKGVAAALMMAHLNASFRTLIQVGVPLPEILARQNRLLLDSHLPSQYATLVCGRARRGGVVEICNAGHWPPLVARRDRIEALEEGGLPIGMIGDRHYGTATVRLEPGETLFLYTDGLVEARDGGDTEFGAARLSELLARNQTLPPRALADACLFSLGEFLHGARPTDDLSLMAIRREV
jgi:sigma-B regulation protein RsbU (phosphoserine phosphatase)